MADALTLWLVALVGYGENVNRKLHQRHPTLTSEEKVTFSWQDRHCRSAVGVTSTATNVPGGQVLASWHCRSLVGVKG